MKLLQTLATKIKYSKVLFHPQNPLFYQIGRQKGSIYYISNNQTLKEKELFFLSYPKAHFWCLAFSKELDFLITSGEKNPIEIRDPVSGKVINILNGMKSGYSSIQVISSYLYAKGWEEDEVEVYNLHNMNLITTLPLAMRLFQIHPEGQLVAAVICVDFNTPLVFINNNTLCPFRDLTITDDVVAGLFFRPQGDYFVTFGLSSVYEFDKLHISGYDFPSRALRYRITRPCSLRPITMGSPVPLTDRVLFSANGNTFYFPDPNGDLLEFDTLKGTILNNNKIHSKPLVSADIRHDFGLFATVDHAGTIKLWDLQERQPIDAFSPGIIEEFFNKNEEMPSGSKKIRYNGTPELEFF